MDQSHFSDLNPTMIASRTFHSIIQQIQSSNLNFQLQLSPFSANISLKKSPLKDKFGVTAPLMAINNEVASLKSKTVKLENDTFMKRTQSKEDEEGTSEALQELNIKSEIVKNLQLEIRELKKVNENFRSTIEDQDLLIKDLEISHIKRKDIADRLHKELGES